MPRSGGIYTLPPGYFATDGTTIEVSQHNPPLEDIAQALTDSLPRDGSAPMTGNLAMGSNKITNLAAATNPADAVRFDQLPTVTQTTATLTAGTNAQGQGPITTDQVTITVAAANPSGATLPTAVAGDRVIIANRGANPVNIYPATGAAIGALATNAPVLLAVNQSVEFFARSATQWEGQISQPLDADLTAIAALGGTGIAVRTAADTWAQRQFVSTDGSVTFTNPAGVAGDIDLSVGVPLTKYFESAQQTITNAGALTIAHGLSVTPKLMQAVLVCLTAEFGYSVNDEVLINPHGFGDLTARGISVVPDSTNLNVRYGANGFGILNKTTGSSNTPTNASWRLVLRVWA